MAPRAGVGDLLARSQVGKRVQLGPYLTQGLGAGARPEIGRAAAEEVIEDLGRQIEGSHMVFVCCGLGGGICAALGWLIGQRGWNRHPAAHADGGGTVPPIGVRRWRGPVMRGTDANSPCVYG